MNTVAWTPGRVGIIGAGAMGVSLGAMLGQRIAVTLVCRNSRRARSLTSAGAVVRGRIEANSRPALVSSIGELASTGGLSAVFVATKTTAIDEVAAELRPLMPTLGDQPGAPFVVSFQNGIEPGRRLIEQLGDPRVLRMVLNFGARLSEDGSARVALCTPPHLIGCLDPLHMPACRTLAKLLTECGLETRAVDDIEPYVWMKGIINAAMNPVAALTDASVGEVLDSPAGRIVSQLLDEGLAVAAAEGIDLGPDARRRMDETLEAAREHTPSMVEDIREGRTSEVGQLNRQIIAHAGRIGVPAPAHELVTSLIDSFDWRVHRRADRPLAGPALCGKAPRLYAAR